MNRPRGSNDPAHYEIRVAGHLDESWSPWLGGMALVRHDDGSTTLGGSVTDQAALYGVLLRVRDLGATLISVTKREAFLSDAMGGMKKG